VGTGAIVMMLLAMLVIWGSLVLAVVNLSRSKDVPATDEIHRDL
jgi:hypothetical protein